MIARPLFPETRALPSAPVVSQLDAPRELALLRSTSGPEKTLTPRMLLVGHVVFGGQTGSTLSRGGFGDLPETEVEVREIGTLGAKCAVDPQWLTGREASATRWWSQASPWLGRTAGTP